MVKILQGYRDTWVTGLQGYRATGLQVYRDTGIQALNTTQGNKHSYQTSSYSGSKYHTGTQA